MMSYDDEEGEPTPRVSAEVEGDAIKATFSIGMPTTEEVADAFARRMYADYSAGKDLRAAAADRFGDLISEAVDDAAKKAIADALAAPRQPTDEFGNPTGPARTFAQLIGEQVKAWQDQTVDPYNGSPKAGGGYNSNVITRAQYLVRQVGAAEFEKQAKEAVAAVRTEAKAMVETSIKQAVASSLSALSK
jgi:hypothetical protein